MKKRPESLYLDLLKKALSYELWPEPPMPVDAFSSDWSSAKRLMYAALSRILESRRLLLVRRRRGVYGDERREGRIWPGYAHTMIGNMRLDNLQFCIETALAEGMEGI